MKLGSCIHERKLAARRGDEVSQVAAHIYETGHELNFAAVKVLSHVGNKTNREWIEAWSTDGNSVKRCVELAPVYRALRDYL
ncbi:unnamed protein product [Dibothriocephalus latus]|uniref:Uncharacterized protein n=1 Tax=Dibothriocephalus latus TaxID=60516 RepID=A0A3P7L6F4_DIBLA|nr:unnamed protein product [Dibothriocephalus latus]